MTTTQTDAARRIADELIAIGDAAPTSRLQRLGLSAEAMRGFVQAGAIEEPAARDNLLLAAVRAGLDAREASSAIQRAWPSSAPPDAASLHAVAFPPPEPDGFEDVADALDAFDPEKTGEFPTALGCAAHGLKCLEGYLRTVDDRLVGPNVPDRWHLAAGSLSLIPDHLTRLVKDIGRRLPDDHLADGLAIAVLLVVQVAVDLGLDLGDALVRNVPIKPAPSVRAAKPA